MKITVKQFKEIVNHVDPDWNLEFCKWEHMSPTSDGPYQGYRGMPNLTEVIVIDVSYRYDDITGKQIVRFIVQDEDDGVEGTPQQLIDRFTKGLDDDDFMEFVLEVEETPGHYDHIPLKISAGDKSYSDKFMYIDLEEEV